MEKLEFVWRFNRILICNYMYNQKNYGQKYKTCYKDRIDLVRLRFNFKNLHYGRNNTSNVTVQIERMFLEP